MKRRRTKEPGNPDRHNLHGIELADRGFLDEAMQEFSRALALDPLAPFPRINRASVYIEKGKLLEALSDLVDAVRVAPDNESARYHLGFFLSVHGSNLAVQELEGVLRHEPEHVDALIQLAITFMDRGEFEPAEKALRSAIDKDPRNPTANHELGNLLADTGRVHEAIGFLRAASQIQPDDLDILIDLGVAFVQAGFLDEGAQHLARVLKKDPENLYAHYNLAAAAALGRRLDECFEHLEPALHSDIRTVQNWLDEDSRFDTVRKDPKFIELCRLSPPDIVVPLA